MDLDVLLVEPDADDVESPGADPTGETGRLLPFAGIGGVDRVVTTPGRPHLDCDPDPIVVGEDVDLATADAHVGGDDRQAVTRQEPAGDRLTETPQVGAVQIVSSESTRRST